MAKDKGLDLVEVSPGADPPVCKILDYGKYRFEQGKRQRESKKKQKMVKLKEMRMQPKIDGHDLAFKVKHIKEFLDDGSKVKVTVRFRGREMAHKELGRNVLDRVLEMLEDSFVLESPPRMEGRFMSLLIAPGSKAKNKPAKTKKELDSKQNPPGLTETKSGTGGKSKPVTKTKIRVKTKTEDKAKKG
jgi:translation initiation factor IF-3